MDIPFYRPDIDVDGADRIAAVLESGWLSPKGETVERFEEDLASFCGADHVVATDSGTAAIRLALAAADIGRGDEVVVPAYTYGATVAAVTATGATPVFADVEPGTAALDPGAVADMVTGRTAAVVVAHLFGRPARLGALRDVADDAGVPLVEDAAQGFGAQHRGAMSGTVGRAGCLSFSWNKPLTTGKGGALVTDDAELAADAREIADYGRDADGRFVRQGFNQRMDSVRAALGRMQMDDVEAVLDRKRDLFRTYHRLLADVDGVDPMDPDGRDGATPSPVFYTVRAEERDDLHDGLADRGIGTDTFYEPLPGLPPFPDPDRPFPGAERVADRVLGLPSSPGMDRDAVERVAAAVRDIAGA